VTTPVIWQRRRLSRPCVSKLLRHVYSAHRPTYPTRKERCWSDVPDSTSLGPAFMPAGHNQQHAAGLSSNGKLVFFCCLVVISESGVCVCMDKTISSVPFVCVCMDKTSPLCHVFMCAWTRPSLCHVFVRRAARHRQDISVQSSGPEVVDCVTESLQIHAASWDQQSQSLLQVVLRGTTHFLCDLACSSLCCLCNMHYVIK